MTDLRRRASELDAWRIQFTERQEAIVTQRHELAIDNRLGQCVADFADQVSRGIDILGLPVAATPPDSLEVVRVMGWRVEIQLRIPPDGPIGDNPLDPRKCSRPGRTRESAPLGIRTRNLRIKSNTVYLSAHDPDLGLGRRGLATVLGPCHVVARHLAFDGAWVVARMSRREGLEEQFGGSPALRVVKYLRGKNPGATPRCGAPPGGPA